MVAEIFNIKYFEVIFRWRLPSIGGHLQLGIAFHQRLSSFQAFLILVWSPELKFEISGRSIQWLPRYSTFYILRSSSIGGRLHFEHFWFWFCPMTFRSQTWTGKLWRKYVVSFLLIFVFLPVKTFDSLYENYTCIQLYSNQIFLSTYTPFPNKNTII